MEAKRILAQLMRYDMTENEARVWLYLMRRSGEMTVVNIARGLKMGRTPVYNALEKLEGKGLVSRVVMENGYGYAATGTEYLERYWRGKERRLAEMGERLPELMNTLDGMRMNTGYKAKVEYFVGRKGLEQITYNSLRAEGELMIYEMNASMEGFVNKERAEEFRRIWAEREVMIRQLTNQRDMVDFTEVEKLVADLWDIRYISPEVLAMKFEMLIYNDVVAMYSARGSEVFGVEIHNRNLAEMQKQIFRAMAMGAKQMRKVGSRGEAHVD